MKHCCFRGSSAPEWIIGLFLLCFALELPAEGLYSNSWVRVSATGNLLYRHDEHGVRLLDFSRCGYKGGAVELPDVWRQIEQNRWIMVSPSVNGLDDAAVIQNALNVAG